MVESSDKKGSGDKSFIERYNDATVIETLLIFLHFMTTRRLPWVYAFRELYCINKIYYAYA